MLYERHPDFLPRCVFYSATGYLCPSCGGARMVYALCSLRLLEAFCYNAVLAAGVILLIAYLFLAALAGFGGKRLPSPPTWTYMAFAVILTGYTFMRNIFV